MKPYYQDNAVTIYNEDCLDALREMPDNSVDSIVTDPPYGLAFMGKKWDYDVPSVEVWRECLRVLKPGGHLLSFAGTRTQHRMAVNIEDAGFDIRDMIAWVYGSGFPKSLDVSKEIDKAAGILRGKAGPKKQGDSKRSFGQHYASRAKGAPATPAARQWQGWGTALKPALEPVTVARKPFKGTVAANVLEHGTGAINVDGCRVGTELIKSNGEGAGGLQKGAKAHGARPYKNGLAHKATPSEHAGRWPANLIHDGSDEVVGLFPVTTSGARSGNYANGAFSSGSVNKELRGSTGSAARFFYCAKASKRDRDEGCEGLPQRSAGKCVDRDEDTAGMNSPRAGAGRTSGSRNHHPTVKPTDLMRYLCRLVTPPGGIVLDPFTGSGSTGKAARLEGFRFIGIEREADYCEIAKARITARRMAQDVLPL